MTMPELPHIQGLPSYHDLDYWGPFFQAASEEHVVMCLHIGQGFGAINSAPGAPIDNLIILATQVSALAAQDLLWGGAFRTYPDLKVAWSEAGIDGSRFYLNRCDRHYLNQRWLGHDFGTKLPSDIFRDHSLACYVTDPTALKVREDIGIDIIAWSATTRTPIPFSRLPPSSCMPSWKPPGAVMSRSQDHLGKHLPLFEWDRSGICRVPDATVAALRHKSPDVDTTIRSKHEWRARYETAGAAPRG